LVNHAAIRKPTLAAPPSSPASSGRLVFGQVSMTSATPSPHSPPRPIAPRNRQAPSCQMLWQKPESPVNTAYIMTVAIIVLTRPMRSPSRPKTTPPADMPSRNSATVMLSIGPIVALSVVPMNCLSAGGTAQE
jgi:hypothetical protein